MSTASSEIVDSIRVGKRYVDAYRVARALVTMGFVLKIIAILAGAGVGLIGLLFMLLGLATMTRSDFGLLVVAPGCWRSPSRLCWD